MCLSSLRLASSLALFCVVASAWADKVVEKPVAADTPEKFDQTIAEVRQEMSPGGRYEYMRPDEKGKVEADMHAMALMLKKSGSVAAMSEAEKVSLFDAQENLNGILTHSDSNRLICEHVAPVGTSIPKTTCKTVGEIERARKATGRELHKIAIESSVCDNSHLVGHICSNN
jgi:hypothetical protein